MLPDRPKLRYLESLPFEDQGKQLILLRDPTKISEQALAVTPELYSLLLLFDGEHSLLEIQAEMTRRQGQIVLQEEVARLLAELDSSLFLENENFQSHRSDLVASYRNETVRQAHHAGLSYPGEALQLSETLSSFYTDTKASGLPGSRKKQNLRALVAPHIDLRLGGATYTHAYRELAESEPPDLFVILGTGHMGLPELFSVSSKDFQTPLGTAVLDRDFLRLLREQCKEPLFEEDLTHRNEHTIEFQIVFLQHLFPTQPIRILPVLCSFSYLELCTSPYSERARPLFWKFVEGVRKAEERSGKRVCWIASVDLAHIGPRYGDALRPTEEDIEQASAKDLEMLDQVAAGDAENFFRLVQDERDQRRICGFSPLYTLLNLIDGQPGRLLAHDHSIMDPSGSFVTYASMVF